MRSGGMPGAGKPPSRIFKDWWSENGSVFGHQNVSKLRHKNVAKKHCQNDTKLRDRNVSKMTHKNVAKNASNFGHRNVSKTRHKNRFKKCHKKLTQNVTKLGDQNVSKMRHKNVAKNAPNCGHRKVSKTDHKSQTKKWHKNAPEPALQKVLMSLNRKMSRGGHQSGPRSTKIPRRRSRPASAQNEKSFWIETQNESLLKAIRRCASQPHIFCHILKKPYQNFQ